MNNDGDNHNDGDGPNATDSKREPNVEIPTHEQEIVRLRDECAQLEQQLQRQLADAANVRRRAQQEKAARPAPQLPPGIKDYEDA